MKPSLFYKVASVLLLLFALGHTFGFRQIDPHWGIGPLIQSMQSIRFNANGSNRTYWGFYVGFGLFVTVMLLFAAAVAWQLGSLPPAALLRLPLVAWSFPACFALIVYLSGRYFFPIPVIFSLLILVCLTCAAWLSHSSQATLPQPNV